MVRSPIRRVCPSLAHAICVLVFIVAGCVSVAQSLDSINAACTRLGHNNGCASRANARCDICGALAIEVSRELRTTPKANSACSAWSLMGPMMQTLNRYVFVWSDYFAFRRPVAFLWFVFWVLPSLGVDTEDAAAVEVAFFRWYHGDELIAGGANDPYGVCSDLRSNQVEFCVASRSSIVRRAIVHLLTDYGVDGGSLMSRGHSDGYKNLGYQPDFHVRSAASLNPPIHDALVNGSVVLPSCCGAFTLLSYATLKLEALVAASMHYVDLAASSRGSTNCHHAPIGVILSVLCFAPPTKSTHGEKRALEEPPMGEEWDHSVPPVTPEANGVYASFDCTSSGSDDGKVHFGWAGEHANRVMEFYERYFNVVAEQYTRAVWENHYSRATNTLKSPHEDEL